MYMKSAAVITYLEPRHCGTVGLIGMPPQHSPVRGARRSFGPFRRVETITSGGLHREQMPSGSCSGLCSPRYSRSWVAVSAPGAGGGRWGSGCGVHSVDTRSLVRGQQPHHHTFRLGRSCCFQLHWLGCWCVPSSSICPAWTGAWAWALDLEHRCDH